MSRRNSCLFNDLWDVRTSGHHFPKNFAEVILCVKYLMEITVLMSHMSRSARMFVAYTTRGPGKTGDSELRYFSLD